MDRKIVGGTIATATHSSGNRLTSMSAAARRVRAVLPSGDIDPAGVLLSESLREMFN